MLYGMPVSSPGVSGPTQIPLSPSGVPLIQGMPQMIPAQGQYVQGMPQMQQQVPIGYPNPQPQMPPQQQFVPQGRLQLGGDEVLDGPGVPSELRGRRWSEVARMYGVLADDFITRKRQVGQPQPQGQPQHPAQPQGQPQQFQGQPQAPRPSFFQDPNIDERLAGIVKQVVGEAVAPFQQQTAATQARTAYDQARQSIPDFQFLEPDIMEAVKGSTPEAMANPEYWQHAADFARGRRMRMNQPPMQPQQRPQFVPQQLMPAPNGSVGFPNGLNGGYPQAVPAQQGYPQPQAPWSQGGFQPPAPPYYTQPPMGVQQMQPRPQTYQFFSEAPTPPVTQMQGMYPGSISPMQMEIASRAGMSPEQYMVAQSWMTRGR